MRRGSAICLTCVLCLVAVTVASAGQSIAPRDAIFRTAKERIAVRVGTYCTSSEPDEQGVATGICADAVAPTKPPRPRLGVRVGGTVELRLPDNPDALDDPKRLSVALARVSSRGVRYLPGEVATVPLDNVERRLWELALPDELRDANALDVFVRYRAGGDASYLAGIKP